MTEETKELTDIVQTQSKKKEEKKQNLKKKKISIPSIIINTEPIEHTECKKVEEKKFLGLKRKLFKKKKEKKEQKLLISKQKDYFINNSSSIKNNEECIICLEKISRKDRHFLHCGHYFHCDCINKWLSMDKNKCPLCKQNIECDKSSLNDDSLNIDFNNDELFANNNSTEIISKKQLTLIFIYIWVLTIYYFLSPA